MGAGGRVVNQPGVQGVSAAPIAPQQVLKALALTGTEGFEVSLKRSSNGPRR